MHKTVFFIPVLIALSACNTWDGAKQDARAVGNKTGDIVEDTGEGLGKAARKTGDAIERGANSVKDAVSD